MRWSREEYLALMCFESLDKQMLTELFGLLVGLEDEWRLQGASLEELDMTGFGLDYVPTVHCGGYTGVNSGLKAQTLEETAEYIIKTDIFGRKAKLCKGYASVALPFSYPVAEMDDWLKIKHWFTFDENRIDEQQIEAAIAAQKQGTLVTASILGGFDLPRELMGEENLCYAYYDCPEMISDMLNTICDTAIKVLDRVSDKVIIDNLKVHEDMAGKSGPLIGGELIREYIAPYYRKVWDMLSSKGTRLFSQDSDGNMNPVIDVFLECGVNVMYPAEPAAGMDMVALRKKYGNRLAFKGGIDKHVLRQDKDAIRKELEYKMQPIMQQGGVVFGLDHRIPNGTPLENYRYYIKTAKELLGITDASYQKGWNRMAF